MSTASAAPREPWPDLQVAPLRAEQEESLWLGCQPPLAGHRHFHDGDLRCVKPALQELRAASWQRPKAARSSQDLLEALREER